MPASFSFWFEESAVTSRRGSLSPTRICPEKIRVKPKIECRMVDLPAPLGPIRQSDWPRPTCRLKSCRISILP